VLHEPRGALVGSGHHEEIATAVRDALAPGGVLVLEVGDGQAPSVTAGLRALGYTEVETTADLAGRERVVEGRR
jgi:release factor glutamine methyltransferase